MPAHRKAQRGTKKADRETHESVERKAIYVLALIADEPWRDGQYGWLAARVRAQYGVALNASQRAVTRAYEILSERAKEQAPKLADKMIRDLEWGIEQAKRKGDLRALALLSVELRKMTGHGDDAPLLPAGVNVNITVQDVEQMHAQNHYTNAQRQAEIDRLTAELATEERKSA